jgi:TolB-like protein
MNSSRAHLSLLLLLPLLLLNACAAPFTLRSEPTDSFPYTWEQTLSSMARGDGVPEGSRPQSKPQPQQRARTSRPSQAQPAPLSVSTKTAPGEFERVAVLELKNLMREQVSAEEVGFLTNELRSVLSLLPKERFLVMTRESIAMLIDPSVRIEDCVGTCEVDTGRMLGAQWIVTGEVVRFGSSLRVALKLHDTQTGQLLYGASARGKDLEELESALTLETLTLMGEMSPFMKQRLDEIAGDDPDARLKAVRSGALRAP